MCIRDSNSCFSSQYCRVDSFVSGLFLSCVQFLSLPFLTHGHPCNTHPSPWFLFKFFLPVLRVCNMRLSSRVDLILKVSCGSSKKLSWGWYYTVASRLGKCGNPAKYIYQLHDWKASASCSCTENENGLHFLTTDAVFFSSFFFFFFALYQAFYVDFLWLVSCL